MASKFYTPPPQVIDGDIAYAADVNDINNETDAAFIQVEADLAVVTDDAAAFAAKAKEWAEGPGEPPDPNVEVEPGLYAARKHRNEAATSAASALTSANNASTSETNAAASEAAAALSESNAATSETNALASENAAALSETNAAASEAAAALSETNAAASEAAAALSETNAATSETNALASETAAALSESNAATSETNAAASEAAAALSETNAASSETNAAASEAAAALSETNAAASEDLANKWATEAEDVEVTPGLYSAYHWAQKAEDVVVGVVDDTPYDASWDGDTTGAPSKNVVYDKIEKKVEARPNILGNPTGYFNQRGIVNGAIVTDLDNLCDRWKVRSGGSGVQVLKVLSTSTGSVVLPNKPWRYFGTQVSTPDDLSNANNYISAAQQSVVFEEIAQLKPNGGDITLSFTVYADIAGTYCVNFVFGNPTLDSYRYTTEFTIDSPLTWEQKEITITVPGEIIENSNTTVFSVNLANISGTNWHVTPDEWSTTTTSKVCSTVNCVNWASVANQRVVFGNVKLEIGAEASGFFWDREEDRNKCFWYYQEYDRPPTRFFSASSKHFNVGAPTTVVVGPFILPSVIRGAPSITITGLKERVGASRFNISPTTYYADYTSDFMSFNLSGTSGYAASASGETYPVEIVTTDLRIIVDADI